MARNKKLQEQSSFVAYMPSVVSDMNSRLHEYLYGPKDEKVEGWLEKIENSSGVKREKVRISVSALEQILKVSNAYLCVFSSLTR